MNDKNFENTLREYTTFLYSNELKDRVSKDSYSATKHKLDFAKWKPVTLESLFEVKGSKTTDKRVLDEDNIKGERKYPFVTTQATNNGVRSFYDFYTDEGNILTLDSAVLGYCAYQPLNFTASDHVEMLIPKFKLNVFRAMFLTTVINKDPRYARFASFKNDLSHILLWCLW